MRKGAYATSISPAPTAAVPRSVAAKIQFAVATATTTIALGATAKPICAPATFTSGTAAQPRRVGHSGRDFHHDH